jgi:hypothetical protein
MDESFAVVALLGSWIGMLWQILGTVVVFGLPFTTILVSGLAISVIIPFLWMFTTGSVGVARSVGERGYQKHQVAMRNHERAERARQREAYFARRGGKK